MGNPITDNMMIGAVGELLVQLRLLEYGVQAAPPLKDTGNDLIAVRGEVFRGIQIKTTAQSKICEPRLPAHYHILAVVHLRANDAELWLDQSEIFLIPRSEIEKTDRIPRELAPFRLSQGVINSLFPVHASGREADGPRPWSGGRNRES